MRDEHEVKDHYQATLCQYSGLQCIACRVKGNDALWIFRAPRFDFESVLEDFKNSETSVYLGEWLKAFNAILSFRNQARRSLDGMWRSVKYASK